MSVFLKPNISLVQVLEQKIFFIFSESYQTRINLSDIYVTHYVKISSSQNALKSVANQDLPKVGSTTLEVSLILQYILMLNFPNKNIMILNKKTQHLVHTGESGGALLNPPMKGESLA